MRLQCPCFFFFNDTAPTEIYTLSYTTLFRSPEYERFHPAPGRVGAPGQAGAPGRVGGGHTCTVTDPPRRTFPGARDRKSTRLNSSHSQISYAVFCLKKKDNQLVAPDCSSIRP